MTNPTKARAEENARQAARSADANEVWHRYGRGCASLDEAYERHALSLAHRAQWTAFGLRHADCCNGDSIDAIEHEHADALAAEQQAAAWRWGHGMYGRPSQAPDADLVERDHREALAMDAQRERELRNGAESEQIGAWRARHAGRSPIQALDVDQAEAIEINEAWDRLHTIGAEGARIDRWHTAQAGLTFDEAVARDEAEAYAMEAERTYIDATRRERDDDSGSRTVRNGRQIAWLDMRRAQGCQTLGDAIAADYAEAHDYHREVKRLSSQIHVGTWRGSCWDNECDGSCRRDEAHAAAVAPVPARAA